jgi:Reverse transcriptase (RNA-dependent DNA polymerase)
VKLDSFTLKQALNSSEEKFWLQAINEELESLAEADTWKLFDHPARARIFPSNFVLKMKRDSSGIVERYKARTVLSGHLQRPAIDSFETYTPVMDFTAVRVALAIACNQFMETHHMGVTCAFLNEKIKEEIYMRIVVSRIFGRRKRVP